MSKQVGKMMSLNADPRQPPLFASLAEVFRVRVQGQAFIRRNWPKQFDESRLVLR